MAKSHKSSKKVLIVEDDNLQQIILERLVTSLGHTVIAKVSKGADAIDSALRLDAIDLILMDIRLDDDIDGIQAMEKIRERSEVGVIYITGNSQTENLKRAQKIGFVEFLPKPVDKTTLEEAFNKAFPNH